MWLRTKIWCCKNNIYTDCNILIFNSNVYLREIRYGYQKIKVAQKKKKWEWKNKRKTAFALAAPHTKTATRRNRRGRKTREREAQQHSVVNKERKLHQRIKYKGKKKQKMGGVGEGERKGREAAVQRYSAGRKRRGKRRAFFLDASKWIQREWKFKHKPWRVFWAKGQQKSMLNKCIWKNSKKTILYFKTY